MALYLLDTDICSYVIRNRPEAVRKRMNAVSLESQAISVVTYAELMFGVRRSSNAKVNRTVVGAFFGMCPCSTGIGTPPMPMPK